MRIKTIPILGRGLAMGVLAALSLWTSPARAESIPPEGGGGLVYVLPIRGQIEPALLYVLRRGLAEAEASKAQAIIFVMDTPGGTLNAASDIVRIIQKLSVPTYTFVEKDALSAGAIIAMATKHIYMAPGSFIGDAMPIMSTIFGGVQEMPEAMQEKAVSAVSALIRSAAQDSGHDPLLAEKMVRRELEYRIGEEVISPTNQLLTLTNVEAERKYGPEEKPLLSSGTVADVPALLKAIGMEKAETRELQVTSTERIARWIAAMAPIFLIGGLLGIYIEIKTPGFGLPGLLGIACLAIFFWGHHIAGLAGLEELAIFAIGAILLMVEVFVIPGFGFVGMAGIFLMTWALLSAMIQRYPGGPWLPSWPQLEIPLFKLSISLIGTLVAALLLGRFLPQTKLFHKLVLERSTRRADGFESSHSDTSLLGQTGLALSALRPSGSAQIAGRRLDVVTQGGFIEAGKPVKVAEVHGNRIVVTAEPGSAPEGPS